MTKVKNSEAASMNKTRIQALEKLQKAVENEKKAKNLEILTYNNLISTATKRSIPKNWKDIKFRRLYLEKLRSLLFNIQKFPELKEKKATEVFNMERDKINPEVWNPIIEKVEKRNAHKTQLLPDDYEGIYCCPRCKSKRTTFYQMQVRSADEPMTSFISCMKCDKTWTE